MLLQCWPSPVSIVIMMTITYLSALLQCWPSPVSIVTMLAITCLSVLLQYWPSPVSIVTVLTSPVSIVTMLTITYQYCYSVGHHLSTLLQCWPEKHRLSFSLNPRTLWRSPSLCGHLLGWKMFPTWNSYLCNHFSLMSSNNSVARSQGRRMTSLRPAYTMS